MTISPGGRGPLEVMWRGTHVGTLKDVKIDMWIWDGRFVASTAPGAQEFLALARKLDTKTVLADPTKSTRVELRETGKPDGEPIHGIVLQLFDDDALALQYVFRPERIEWLLQNVE